MLRWLRELDSWLHDQDDSPPRGAVLAVAAKRLLHANPSGAGCFISQEVIARSLDYGRPLVRAVDRYLVKHGWLTQTGTVGRGRTAVYRLTMPAVDVLDGGTQDSTVAADDAPLGDHRRGRRWTDGGSTEVTRIPLPPNSDPKGRSKEEVSPRPARGGRTATKEPGTGTGSERNGPPPPEALNLLAAARQLVPDLDVDNRDIQAQAFRLAAGGWPWPTLRDALKRRMPANVDSPTGFVLARLRKLPDHPADHLGTQLAMRGPLTEYDPCCHCSIDDQTGEPLPKGSAAEWQKVTGPDAEPAYYPGLCRGCLPHRNEYVDDDEPPVRWRHMVTGELLDEPVPP